MPDEKDTQAQSGQGNGASPPQDDPVPPSRPDPVHEKKGGVEQIVEVLGEQVKRLGDKVASFFEKNPEIAAQALKIFASFPPRNLEADRIAREGPRMSYAVSMVREAHAALSDAALWEIAGAKDVAVGMRAVVIQGMEELIRAHSHEQWAANIEIERARLGIPGVAQVKIEVPQPAAESKPPITPDPPTKHEEIAAPSPTTGVQAGEAVEAKATE